MATARTILHVDMDAFFAAIEQLDNPSLRGRRVLVGHDGPRGVVTTASYEARPFGCHSAQPMVTAKRLCPSAIVVPVRGARYREISAALFDVLDHFSPIVEPLSIDEAFVDVTGSERLLGPPEQIGRKVKDRVKQELGLTASVGIAANKYLAKLASDLEKPDGLTIIRAQDVDTVLPPLPVTKIWGIGPATAAKLERLQVRTIGDLRSKSTAWMQRQFGADGDRFHRLSRGVDRRAVTPDSRAKSIGHEQTFAADLADPDEVRRILLGQVEQVARRLRKHALTTRTVTLKIRYGNFQTITRSATLDQLSDATSELWQASKQLFDRWCDKSFQPVRLIGMTAGQLSTGPVQMPLFDDPNRQRQRRVDQATDRITEKFGKKAVRRAGANR